MTIGDEKVVRYRLVFECSMDDSGGHMDARKDGEWVEYSAYAELAAERDRLQAAYDALTGEKFSDRVHAALQSRATNAESQLAELRGQLVGLAVMLERSSTQEYVPLANELRTLAAADGGGK